MMMLDNPNWIKKDFGHGSKLGLAVQVQMGVLSIGSRSGFMSASENGFEFLKCPPKDGTEAE